MEKTFGISKQIGTSGIEVINYNASPFQSTPNVNLVKMELNCLLVNYITIFIDLTQKPQILLDRVKM
jgi:hypothetical protein